MIPVTKKAVHTYIEHNLTENFGRSIVFDDIKGRFFQNYAFKCCYSKFDIYGQEPLAEVKEVHITISIFQFLTHFEPFQTIVFDKVSMNVIREKNKKVNVLDLIKPAEKSKKL